MTTRHERQHSVFGQPSDVDAGATPVERDFQVVANAGNSQPQDSHPCLSQAIRYLALVTDDEELNTGKLNPDRLAAALQNHGALLDAAMIDVLQQWLEEWS
ncbi:MAG: hypothetical protein WCA32_16060 [Chromatiaceae bacterium]